METFGPEGKVAEAQTIEELDFFPALYFATLYPRDPIEPADQDFWLGK